MLIAAWINFIGAVPKVTPRKLGDGFGVNASNLRLGFGDLRGWNASLYVQTTGGATPLKSMYRMNAAAISDTDYWLQWTTDVNVVRSLIASDTTEEIYYTGDGVPKRTNNVIGLPGAPGPAAWRTLGIPAPSSALTAAVLVAGGAPNETRVYVDTFVNDQGRESAPGLTYTIVVAGGSTMTLNAFAAAPGGYPDLTLRRIYVSTDGGEYQRVVEIAIATTTTTDALARGAVMQSGGDVDKPAWLMPPSTLSGLIGLHNGMIGGFFGKSYAVCEPNKPWAWPVEYQDVVFDDIVGTGKWLQNWLILTTAFPVLITGSSPLSLSQQPLPRNWACRSKRSIVSLGHGVVWASQNGLAYIGQNGQAILTENILSTEQWAAMNPSTMFGSKLENYYVCFYNDGADKAFLIDPLNPTGIIYINPAARAAYYDNLSDRLYLSIAGNIVMRWGGGAAAPATFKTGIKRHPYPANPSHGMLVADEPVSAVVTVWANKLQAGGAYAWTVVFTGTVVSGQEFPMVGNYSAFEFQAEITTTGPVQGFLLAEDPMDLR